MLVCSSLPGFPLTSPVSPPGFSSVSLTKVALACSQQYLASGARGCSRNPWASVQQAPGHLLWNHPQPHHILDWIHLLPPLPCPAHLLWVYHLDKIFIAGHPGLSAAVQDGILSLYPPPLPGQIFRISCASSRSDHGLHYRHPHGASDSSPLEFLHLPQIDIPVFCILTVLPNSNLFSYCFLFLPGWLCF